VIVPVHRGAAVLPHSLAALAASDLPREFWELIVVDDASPDNTVELAAGFADTIARLGYRPHGPSYARNRGAEIAKGEILVFLDADVAVHPDTLRRFAWLFLDDPTLAAAFGSYDDRPVAAGLVSQYRNLFHHYVHQQNGGEAETFWAGCGAVRRQVFLDVGMYNEWHFSRPQIEDIELGHRLRDHGHRILLRPEIQATHLKRWTFRNMVTTDLKDRGVPWTRLLIQREQTSEARSLNLRLQERVCTAAVWAALVLAAIGVLWRDWRWGAAAGIVVGAVLLANLPLYRFFRRTRGLAFAIGVLPLHLTYYILNGVSVMVAVVLHQTVGDPTPPASVQAFAERGVVKWPPVPKPVPAPNTGAESADPSRGQ
jgi:glycosyltransferase involved in cell wall biosynthesis